MKNKPLKIPTEISRFKLGYFGIEIEWINPFDTTSVIQIINYEGDIIYKGYIQNNTITIFDIEKHIAKSYSVEIKEISTGEIKGYSVAY